MQDERARAEVLAALEAVDLVVIFEDDTPIRKLVRSVLHNQGYTILEAADGYEALALARQHPGSHPR